MSTEYRVVVEPFADRHFIKKFKKKHGRTFEAAWKAELLLFKKFDALLDLSMAETISQHEEFRICKTEFRITGNESRKSSGNRCIVLVNDASREVQVLLVYHKSDITKGSNENASWQKLVRTEYSKYRFLLPV